jgi:CRISPR-associated protein Cas1
MIGKESLSDVLAKIDNAIDVQELLGLEGSATKQFFKLYFKELNWIRRSPRSKVDQYNTLLDIGYTLIFNFVESILKLHGFDTYKGVYHTLFFQRKSLACDFVEPFRCIIDKTLLKAYHLKQIKNDDFTVEGDKFLLSYQKQYHYIKIFTEAIMENKEEIFSYIRDSYYSILNDHESLPVFEFIK